jgi:ferritin-like metal-binding protein YciE
MAIGSLKELYLDELCALYDAEAVVMRVLAQLIDAARSAELRDLLARHCGESRLQIERLQLIFTRLGLRVSSHTCTGLAGIVQEADDRLNQPTTPEVRDAAVIGIAQRIEHYEIAAYGSARSYARRLNRPDEARLLQETLEEEERASDRLTQIADANINDEARSREATLPTRLRYVGSEQLDRSRLTNGTLEIRNDNDDVLGEFDGLIVDAFSAHTQYVVVARGVLSERRYLLPVHDVRYDPASRLLRVDLGKKRVRRYPEFSRDELLQMDGAVPRGVESRLVALLGRDEGGGEREPDWVRTGIWMTVPPKGGPQPTTEEARSYRTLSRRTASRPRKGRRRQSNAVASPTANDVPTHGDPPCCIVRLSDPRRG